MDGWNEDKPKPQHSLQCQRQSQCQSQSQSMHARCQIPVPRGCTHQPTNPWQYPNIQRTTLGEVLISFRDTKDGRASPFWSNSTSDVIKINDLERKVMQPVQLFYPNSYFFHFIMAIWPYGIYFIFYILPWFGPLPGIAIVSL